jgi:hypothetical protein
MLPVNLDRTLPKMLFFVYRRRWELRNIQSSTPLELASVAFLSSTRQGQAACGGDCLASGSGNLEISK